MPIQWRLKELLERHDLSVYALSEHMGGLRGGANKRPGLYAIANADETKRPTRVSFEQLSEILTALNEMTEMEHQISDVLEFTPDPLPSWRVVPEGWQEWIDSFERADDPSVDTQTIERKKRGRPRGSRNRKTPV